jgi:hypothetical protein
MLDNLHTSFIYRLGRSMLPSPMSGLLCVLAGIGIVGGYLLMMSVSLGTSLPSLFDGEWGVWYTNHIVQPLLTVFSNLTLNKLVFLGLWGLAGLITYFLLEYGVRALRNARSAEHDIQITATGIIRHPAMSSFFVAALWRVFILATFLPLLIIAILNPVESLSSLAPKAVLGDISGSSTILRVIWLALQFSFCAHLLVVFLRLFAMRMRLFGDDPV